MIIQTPHTSSKDENKCGAMESIKADLPTPYLKGFMRLVEALKDAFKLEEDRLKWKQSPLGNAADFDDALYVECVLDAIRFLNRFSHLSFGGFKHAL